MRESRELIEIDVREILLALLRGWKWILLAMLVGGLAAFSITWWLIPPKYASSVSLYVNNVSDSGQAASTAVNINDLNASQKLVNTYIVILQDDEVLEKVAERLLGEYTQQSLESILPFTETAEGQVLTPDALRDVIRMSAVNNTEVLRIEAKTKSAELSARICALMTEEAPDVLERVVKAGSVEVIGKAKPALSPTSPNLKLNCAIGLMVGAVLAAIVILVLRMLDNTVGGEEELKKRLTIPILGEIPDFDTARKGSYRGYGYG